MFEGHTDRITDLVVSEDCRWLLSSSMDGTLRVWDVPAATTLQARPSPDACLMRGTAAPRSFAKPRVAVLLTVLVDSTAGLSLAARTLSVPYAKPLCLRLIVV